MKRGKLRRINLIYARCRTSNIRVAVGCATGDGCLHLTTEHGHSVSRRGCQSTGIKTRICPAPPLPSGLNKSRTLSCSGIALPFFLSYYHSLIVVLDRTVPDVYIASLRCGTSNIRVAVGCATGDGYPHLTTEHGHSMPRSGFQSTGIKTVIRPAPPLFSGLNNCRTLSFAGIALPILFS